MALNLYELVFRPKIKIPGWTLKENFALRAAVSAETASRII